MASQKRKVSSHDDVSKIKVRVHIFISSAVLTDQIQRARSELPATNEETTPAAYEAVLLTTELLENILLHVPPKDLLLVQRVSRKWRDLIGKSVPLQEKLFFKPAKIAPNNYWQWSRKPGLDCERVDIQAAAKKQFEGFAHAVEVNPFLHLTRSTGPQGVRDTLKLPMHWMAQFEHGSWRKMYLTQPVAGWLLFGDHPAIGYYLPNEPAIGELIDGPNGLWGLWELHSVDSINWSKAKFALDTTRIFLATMEGVEKGVVPIPKAWKV